LRRLRGAQLLSQPLAQHVHRIAAGMCCRGRLGLGSSGLAARDRCLVLALRGHARRHVAEVLGSLQRRGLGQHGQQAGDGSATQNGAERSGHGSGPPGRAAEDRV
jgi:hypothetical protein